MMAGGRIVEQLASGEAFADLSYWRKVAVSGSDALEWLNDLVTADLSGLAPGHARHALFLSPMGGIRASFTVSVLDGNFLLIQDPMQSAPVQHLLEPYVLSSDVTLADRTSELAVFAFPGRRDAPSLAGTIHWAPSCLGPGVDVVAAGEGRDVLLRSLWQVYSHAGDEEVEAWRVSAGIPRFGVDALEGDLPQEAGLSSAVSRAKGCFPGQEAVAKVDSLGHPRRVVLALEADGPVSPGDPVMLDGSKVGEITSVAASGGRTLVLARLRWEARDARLHTGLGAGLRHRAPSPGVG
jgi:folate-binding protein YgfZ